MILFLFFVVVDHFFRSSPKLSRSSIHSSITQIIYEGDNISFGISLVQRKDETKTTKIKDDSSSFIALRRLYTHRGLPVL